MDACRIRLPPGRVDSATVGSPTGQGRAVRWGGIAPSPGAAACLVGAVVALSLLGSALLGVRLWPGGPGAGPAPATPTPTPGKVDTTVAGVRQTAAPVVQALPPTVQAPVQAAGDGLQHTAATAGQALAPVTSKLP